MGTFPARAATAGVVPTGAPGGSPATPVVPACYGPLRPLAADRGVTEIVINGPGPVWVERDGRLEVTPVHLDAVRLEGLVERLLAGAGRRVDTGSPLVDARLPDGARINVAVPPVAVNGPLVTIRRFPPAGIGLGDFAGPPGVHELLDRLITDRWNLVISGPTAAGKTTLLAALIDRLPAGERIVTVEDAAELPVGDRHAARLETRPANADAAGEVTVRDLVRNALRMRPDRIVVGEVRGREVLDLLAALNTGHDGTLATCHANGPADALRRLELMAALAPERPPLEVVRAHIGAAVDGIIHVTRGVDGRRRIDRVAEVVPPRAPGDPPGVRVLVAGTSADAGDPGRVRRGRP